MAIDTLPEPTVRTTTPNRLGLGFLTATPIIAAATICLVLVIASAILAPWLSPHDPLLLAPAQRLKARQRAILARHGCLWSRCAVADSLWRTDIAAHWFGRRRRQHLHRAADRSRLGFLHMDRRDHDARDGRADGDPGHFARHRRGVAVGRQPDHGSGRDSRFPKCRASRA